MKHLMYKASGLLAALALLVTTAGVNSTCFVLMHQAEVPEAAKKLRQF